MKTNQSEGGDRTSYRIPVRVGYGAGLLADGRLSVRLSVRRHGWVAARCQLGWL